MVHSLAIRNVHLAHHGEDASQAFDVLCADGRVASITSWTAERLHEDSVEEIDGRGRALLLPALCHAHIHLDKCYLLDRGKLTTGNFTEALEVTARAKASFVTDTKDLYERGKKLIADSVAAGVTSMRAHVEIDTTVKLECLNIGRALKSDMEYMCDVMLCAFAQDPLFAPESSIYSPGPNHALMCEALDGPDISAVGSAPYVEPSPDHARANIMIILDLAFAYTLDADFHLDYNLDAATEPLIWFLLEELRQRILDGRWRETSRVCVGHATRLVLFDDVEWTRYKDMVYDETCPLPITLVGLPQSDMYMMGRGVKPAAPRGTLDVCALKKRGIDVAMAVNNVGNAFTPQGAPDPLALCTLGVALFQDATDTGCRALLDAVTTTAKEAIDLGKSTLVPRVGDPADFVLLHDNDSIQSAVCNPSYSRTTIKGGQVVANRTGVTVFPDKAR